MKTIQRLSSLSGKVACVTGGGGNLGSVFCHTLAELGAEVAVLDLNQDKATQIARNLEEAYGGKASAIKADITSEESVSEALDQIERFHGGVDVLINNAAYASGTLPPDGKTLSEQNLAQWRAQMDVILTGTFLMARECTKPTRSRRLSNIINISSIYGAVGADMSLYEGTDMVNEAHYSAAKGGVIQLTRYLATTLAPATRVNCIAPGGVFAGQPDSFLKRYEKRTPLGRMARLEDFPGTIAYLASDLSSYMTGQVLFLDGGWTAW